MVENVETMTQKWDPERLQFKLLPENVAANLNRAATMLTAWELIHSDIVTPSRTSTSSASTRTVTPTTRAISTKSSRESRRTPASSTLRSPGLSRTKPFARATWSCVRALSAAQRNDVAHEMAKYIVDPRHEVSLDLLTEAREVIARLGRFWGQIEVDISPDFDDREVDVDGIRSGASLLYDYVLSLVSIRLEPTDPESAEPNDLPS